MKDEIHNLKKYKDRKKKDKSKNKEQYVTVIFKADSPKYRKKEYYYKTEKDLKTGEQLRVNTIFSDKSKAVIKRTGLKKPKIKPTIKEIK